MPYVFSYTKKGEKLYTCGNKDNYPEFTALNCDVNDSMHLALSYDGKSYFPLRNSTGILFPKADYNSKAVGGTTKTLIQPWIFRRNDGGFGIFAVRRNQNAADTEKIGNIMLFFSHDLIHYSEEQFIKVSEGEIANPRCRWEDRKESYYLEWESEQGLFCGYTDNFTDVHHIKKVEKSSFESFSDCKIQDAVPGNIIEIDEDEAKKISNYLGCIYHTGTEIEKLIIKEGEEIAFEKLPGARCLYNDGSVHDKKVKWEKADYQKIDFSKKGVYSISGEIIPSENYFPFVDFNVTDPYIFLYQNQYYMILLDLAGGRSILAWKSDTIEGIRDAKPVEIIRSREGSNDNGNLWAPELHVINGVPYIFTTMGTKNWNTTKCCIYKCTGDIMNAEDWQGPYLVVKPDETPLRADGVSLDMTYFQVEDVHYVMWSDRKWVDPNKEMEPAVQDSANILIASIDPENPWRLTSMPVCIGKPVYGWERYETKVDEGPYVLRRGEDIFVTIACSSTGLADLYCVGLMHTKADKNLLSCDSWDWLTFPILTKESVPGEFGPGHNCFVKDLKNKEDLFVYHAVLHDKDGKAMGRYMGIRRVHWGINGYPYLEMTEERDVNPLMRNVVLKIEIV